MYVSDHPLRPYANLLKKNSDYSLLVFARSTDEDEMEMPEAGQTSLADRISSEKTIKLAGMVRNLTPMVSKRGERMAKFTLEDTEGSIEAIIFPKYFSEYGEFLEPPSTDQEAIVTVNCRYEASDRGQQILVSKVSRLRLEGETSKVAQVFELHITSDRFNQQISDQLTRVLQRYPGRDPVVLFLAQSGGGKLRAELPITVDSTSADLIGELKSLLGDDALAASAKNGS